MNQHLSQIRFNNRLFDRPGVGEVWDAPVSPLLEERREFPDCECTLPHLRNQAPYSENWSQFDQGKYWVDGKRVRHEISHMNSKWLMNCESYLLDQCRTARFWFEMVMHGYGNYPQMDWEMDITYTDPEAWLRSTRLFQALESARTMRKREALRAGYSG